MFILEEEGCSLKEGLLKEENMFVKKKRRVVTKREEIGSLKRKRCLVDRKRWRKKRCSGIMYFWIICSVSDIECVCISVEMEEEEV